MNRATRGWGVALVSGMIAATLATPAAAANPKESVFEADCLVAGRVDVGAVFFADPNPQGGAGSAFRVIADERTFIVYTPGTDRQPDDFCSFTWKSGAIPGADMLAFEALVFVTPQHDRGRWIWNPALDWRHSPDNGNPSPDAYGNEGVWSYMRSSSFAHDPSTYSLLPTYLPDSETWSDPEHDNLLLWYAPTVPRTVGMHSWGGRVIDDGRNAVLRWVSPISGLVRIAGFVSLSDPECVALGSGINWSIDHGTTSLYEVTLPSGGRANFDVTTIVQPGDPVYFVHDPGWDSDCDSASVRIVITR